METVLPIRHVLEGDGEAGEYGPTKARAEVDDAEARRAAWSDAEVGAVRVNAPRRWSSAITKGAPQTPVWSAPDPALAAAGIEGEYVVARVRLVAMSLLLISPTFSLVSSGGDNPMHVVGFVVTVISALASYAIWAMLRRGQWRPWVGFASSAFDVQ